MLEEQKSVLQAFHVIVFQPAASWETMLEADSEVDVGEPSNASVRVQFATNMNQLWLTCRSCSWRCDGWAHVSRSAAVTASVPQVSWWRWSIYAWTAITSAFHRHRAAARRSRPPASPQASRTLQPICSSTAQPAPRASREGGSCSNLRPCPPPASQHQSDAAL